MLYICGRNSTPGDVCTSSAWVADIFKRRLLALCSDSMKSRKFLPDKNLATIDVLRDIDYPSCAHLVHCLRIYVYACAYLNYVARRMFIFGVGFALLFQYLRQCEGLKTWNDSSRNPRFLYAYVNNPDKKEKIENR